MSKQSLVELLAMMEAIAGTIPQKSNRGNVMKSVDDFRKFLEKYPDRVKEPD